MNEQITELMNSGLELMFAGMGIVYLFLTMLVFAINAMSWFVQRYFPEETVTVTTVISDSAPDKRYIAAITAAVHQYRNR
jgi:oxaloacetate decarboxylase gamma subunit